MSKRLLAILVLCFMPFTALADASAPADSSGLGPAATTNSGGSSSADSGALQPAGQSPLQSTNGDSSGLTAPNANSLQTPVSGDAALKVLADNADGSTTSSGGSDDAPAYWGWLWASLLVAVVVAGSILVMRDRRRFAGHPADARPTNTPSLPHDDAVTSESEPVSDEAAEVSSQPAEAASALESAPNSTTHQAGRSKHHKRRKH